MGPVIGGASSGRVLLFKSQVADLPLIPALCLWALLSLLSFLIT